MKVWGTATGKDLLTLRHGENGAGEEKALLLRLHFGRRVSAGAHLRQRLHGRALGPHHRGKDIDVKTRLLHILLDPFLRNIAPPVLRPVKTAKIVLPVLCVVMVVCPPF